MGKKLYIQPYRVYVDNSPWSHLTIIFTASLNLSIISLLNSVGGLFLKLEMYTHVNILYIYQLLKSALFLHQY